MDISFNGTHEICNPPKRTSLRLLTKPILKFGTFYFEALHGHWIFKLTESKFMLFPGFDKQFVRFLLAIRVRSLQLKYEQLYLVFRNEKMK